MPVKCITGGQPSPPNDAIRKAYENEALTMDSDWDMLWSVSEAATNQTFVVVGKTSAKL